jgi:heme-degrading monooxygenase HmoA
MFARVITAQAGQDGFDEVIQLATEQLPGAKQRPGFAGYYLLTDDSNGNVVIISLWQTREDMEAVGSEAPDGIHQGGVSTTGLHSMTLETYAVAIRA